MTSPRRPRPTASLFAQLLALIMLSLIAAQAISMFMIFKFPPPVPDFYRLTEVSAAYAGSASRPTDKRPLEVERRRRAPSPAAGSASLEPIRQGLAEAMGVRPQSIVISTDRPPLTDRRVGRMLRDRIEREGGRRDDHFLVAPFEVGVKQADGSWLVVRPEHRLWPDPWRQRVMLWYLLSVLALAPVAYLLARRFSAPIRLFSQAAERLGRDPHSDPLPVAGSAEIAVAAGAFNQMQERLRRYVQDRTAMVAAIAHDLRTPLTRLRFRIEQAPDELRAKMAQDLDEMEEMVSAALAFVRDASRPGRREPMELYSLLESLADDLAETGADVAVEGERKIIIIGDPMALRRMFANLLENAGKFATRARVKVGRIGAEALVEIFDDGPGIPEAELERVFEPFYRREPSRSRQTGGIGLGLAVVRSIARAHGGDVVLRNAEGGGLAAEVRLPA